MRDKWLEATMKRVSGKKRKKRRDSDSSDSSSSDDDVVRIPKKKRYNMAEKAVMKGAPADQTGVNLYQILKANSDEGIQKALIMVLNASAAKNRNVSDLAKRLLRPDEIASMILMLLATMLRRGQATKKVVLEANKKTAKNMVDAGWKESLSDSVSASLSKVSHYWYQNHIDCMDTLGMIVKLIMFSGPYYWNGRIQSVCDAAFKDKYQSPIFDYMQNAKVSDLLRPEIIQRRVDNSAFNRNKGRSSKPNTGYEGSYVRGRGGGRGRGRGRGRGGGRAQNTNDGRCNYDRKNEICPKDSCRFSHQWRDSVKKAPAAEKSGEDAP